MSNKILKYLDVLIPFTANIHRKVHGRGLTDELNLSQKTIQNKLNYLEEEGILKSKNFGRTKEFSLKRENLLTKSVLTMVEMTKFYDFISSNFEVREIITDILREVDSPIIIYGSFAKGNWDDESDLDILVIGESHNIEEIRERYSREIHTMFILEDEFKEGIVKEENYIKEILENHIICRGFENITSWRFEYE
ncbi:MAG: nucleotidyltransferase domain-containing protein [Candidatus Aenigmatarchaeota archaeon]